MKIGKREQKRIDDVMVKFFGYFTASKSGVILNDAFKEYLAKNNLVLREEKWK